MRSGLWVPSTPGDTPQMWAKGCDEGCESDCVRETDMTCTRVDQVPCGVDWE